LNKVAQWCFALLHEDSFALFFHFKLAFQRAKKERPRAFNHRHTFKFPENYNKRGRNRGRIPKLGLRSVLLDNPKECPTRHQTSE
jgi:hypothetical protein